jgi:hypothetical protein
MLSTACKERLREELSSIESKAMTTCHAEPQLTQELGPTNTMSSQQTYRMTLFKIPPPGPMTKTSSSKCTKPCLKRAFKVRSSQAKFKVGLFPLPPLPGVSQITPSFSAPRLSIGWLRIHRVGESRQDVCRPARTRIHQLQSYRRLPARRTLSTTTHSVRRTRNSRRSRAVLAREI